MELVIAIGLTFFTAFILGGFVALSVSRILCLTNHPKVCYRSTELNKGNMTMTISENAVILLNLSYNQILQIRKEYGEMEKAGFTGDDSLLRRKAMELMTLKGMGEPMIPMAMFLLFSDINRYLADLYIAANDTYRNATS